MGESGSVGPPRPTANTWPPGTAAMPPGQGTSGRAALWLALALLTATFFLISPPPGRSYPGAIPWRPGSVLHGLTDAMSLGGWLTSVRGVEVKDLALYLAAAGALAVLGSGQLAAAWGRKRGAASAFGVGHGGPALLDEDSRRAARTAGHAQILLAAWVLLSLASSLWSGDPEASRGQALVYAMQVAWAIGLAALFDQRRLSAFLPGLVVIGAGGAALCVWYYYERNPFHRPGFPLGNPNLLAAAILPATLAAAGACAMHAWEVVAGVRSRGGTSPTDSPSRCGGWRHVVLAITAAAALVPLLWCLGLTNARGALMALLTGAAATVVLLLARRLRWVLVTLAVVGLAASGAIVFYASHLDVTMARGATIRFRVYAWRYAAELWQASPIAGHGAGAYPRLAGQLAGADRALDPAAFMAGLVEHAHNELFEVLTEIGLVGGVTFVGGMLATFVAGAALVRAARDRPQRWQAAVLVGAVIALLADAMVGVSPRLPGGAAVLFTMVGVLWGACGAGARGTWLPAGSGSASVGSESSGGGPRARFSLPRRWGLARSPGATGAACLAAAAAVLWLAATNWTGVQQELAADTAFRQARVATEAATAAVKYFRAREDSLAAEGRLLDPVRKIAARKTALDALAGQARIVAAAAQATTQAVQSDAGSPTQSGGPAESPRNPWRAAVALNEETFAEAARLRVLVPALAYTDAIAARAAERLATLHAAEPPLARDWSRLAEFAWRSQRLRTPFDVETLLALTRFGDDLPTHLGRLRDALRFMDTISLDARRGMYGRWLAALESMARAPDFDQALADMAATVGPIGPDTDLDALVASMAPETHRLLAAWQALRGDYSAAAAEAGRAAQLYRPMKPRFPEQRSIALAEQAGYTLRQSPAGGSDGVRLVEEAVRLAEQALAELPAIQEQKYEDLARPFRLRLALCLLVAGRVKEARAVAVAAVSGTATTEGGSDDADEPGGGPALGAVLQRLVAEAGALGVPPARIEELSAALGLAAPPR